MAQSNGIIGITEIEARLGDAIRDAFFRGDYKEGRAAMCLWAEKNGAPQINFWEYSRNKKPGIHMAPFPWSSGWSSGENRDYSYLVFSDEMAMKILVLGCMP
jgi:hypothetical protein